MKLIKYFLISSFCGLTLYGCGCDEPKKFYQHLTSISLGTFGKNEKKDSDKINEDTLVIGVRFSTSQEFVNSPFSFCSSAYAFGKCIGEEPLGLKNKIDSIVVTSDKDFQGVPAYSSLNFPLSNFFICNLSYPELINYLNQAPNFFEFSIIKNHTDTLNQKFKVLIYTQDGKKVENETLTLAWE